MFNVGTFYGGSWASDRFIPQPRRYVNPDDFNERPPEPKVFEAPRTIKLGIQLDKETGEPTGEFNLPMDDEAHETAIVFIGASGTGKTVGVTRIVDEMRRQYGRSVLIFDSKNQYKFMNKPNKDPNHIRILEEWGEVPSSAGNLRIYIPYHILRKNGKVFCETQYEYTNTWVIKTNQVDAAGMLMLGNKDTEGKDYVNLLAAIVDEMRERERDEHIPFNLETLKGEIRAEQEKGDGKERSTKSLLAMLDILERTSMISDDGNEIMELFHEPKRKEAGDVMIFNTAGSSPEDIQTKGLITNMINGVCYELKKYINLKTKKPMYKPIILAEEASVYYGSKSDNRLIRAFDHLQNVVGRSLGIMRIYVYQNDKQPAKGLIDNDNVQIIIKTVQSLNLEDEYGNIPEYPEQISGKGLAIVTIRNVSFMDDATFYVQILPPRCDIGT